MAKTTKLSFSSWLPRLTIAVLGIATAVGLVVVLRDLVDRRYAGPPVTPRVVLINQPAWMTGALADQIIDAARPVGLHSVFDQKLLIDTARRLTINPWVKEVRQVRRAYVHRPGDTLEVDCSYRVPTALVQWQNYFWLVDGDGYALPSQYTRQQLPKALIGADGKLILRVIEGISHGPVASGKQWPGSDLAGGLELVKLLAGRPFAEQVPIVDVSNYDGRHDARGAQIVLLTKYGTSIRWGRPPSSKDYFMEVPASQKLQVLADIDQQMHRVDGGQPWIDIRSDQVTYPSPVPASATESATQPDIAQARADQ